MKKIILSLSLVLLIVVSFATPVLAADGDVVWKMSADEVTAYVAGGVGNDTAPFIKNCGSGSRAADGASIKFFNRTNDYDCIDIVTKDTLDASKTYTVIAKVRTASGDSTTFKYGMGAGPYSEYFSKDGGNVTLTYKLDAAAGFDFSKNLRIQTNQTTEDWFLDSFIIYEGDPPAASNGGGNAATGDEFIIFAIGALVIASAGVILFTRKAKKSH